MSMGGNSGGATNPFVRRQPTYMQNGMGMDQMPQSQQFQAPQQGTYRSPFSGGMGFSMQRFGMPQGMGQKMMYSQMPNYMGGPPPPNNNPAPPNTGTPPPVTPTPTPAPYTPPVTPTPTPYTPPPPSGPGPSANDPNGILGGNYHPQQGWGQSPGGLMAASTAMFMGGPYGPKSPPPGENMGWNQATQAWEPMK
jgi:hypothetical protein